MITVTIRKQWQRRHHADMLKRLNLDIGTTLELQVAHGAIRSAARPAALHLGRAIARRGKANRMTHRRIAQCVRRFQNQNTPHEAAHNPSATHKPS